MMACLAKQFTQPIMAFIHEQRGFCRNYFTRNAEKATFDACKECARLAKIREI